MKNREGLGAFITRVDTRCKWGGANIQICIYVLNLNVSFLPDMMSSFIHAND